MTDHITHDLALARAERDAYADTCEELHRTIAGLHVEIDAHLGHREAADQRVRSLDAALTHERKAGKALTAQVEGWRAAWDRIVTIVDEAFGPFPVMSADDTIKAMERGIHDGIRAAQELAAIRDLVAPGNPQGAVVDAVRADKAAAWERIKGENQRAIDAEAARDAAIARAEKAERDVDELAEAQAATLIDAAKLRAEVAELRAKLTQAAPPAPPLPVDDMPWLRVGKAMTTAVDAERDAVIAEMGGKNTSGKALPDSASLWARQWNAAAKAAIAAIGTAADLFCCPPARTAGGRAAIAHALTDAEQRGREAVLATIRTALGHAVIDDEPPTATIARILDERERYGEALAERNAALATAPEVVRRG